ncbi:heavy-metal-associated domain-containing protein [Hoeflea sp.]|uniref:heavy-metal-associated domain-containing protein n=1 Tax=Hoeflea sp. TaxID=1940281 RepID=UPI0037494686
MTVSIKIEGMHCGGCANSVGKAAKAIDGVSNVHVSIETNELIADLAKPELVDALKGAIEDIGFDVVGICN